MNQFALKSFQSICAGFRLKKLIDITPADISRLQAAAVAAGFSGIDFLLGGRSYKTFTDEENYIQDLEGCRHGYDEQFVETDDGMRISVFLDPQIFRHWSEGIQLAALKPAISPCCSRFPRTDAPLGDLLASLA